MSVMFTSETECRIACDTGKGASRRLRRAKLVPGIVYGAGKEPKMIQVSAFELAS
jgi:large subunit ribosomal protein L25